MLMLTASSLNSQTASALSSSEQINLMMHRRITADIQRSQRGFTLDLMTPMVFSIRRVAPSPRCVYRHVLCHQSAQHAVRRVVLSPRYVWHVLYHQSAQHAVRRVVLSPRYVWHVLCHQSTAMAFSI